MTQMNNLLEACVNILSKEYGDPLLNNRDDPIEEIVFALLSEKTDEPKYLKAFHDLRNRFPTWNDVYAASISEIEAVIAPAGMGRRRALLLKRLFDAILENFGAFDLSSLASMAENEAEQRLLSLPGIGFKAARCVLLYCFDFPVLVVDTHTYRLAVRLGVLSRKIPYQEAHKVLPRSVPERLRRRFHINAVAHGRLRCFSRKPNCSGCPIRQFCLEADAVRPVRVRVRPRSLCIDVFSGAGGLSLGFERAGVQIVQAVDVDARATATYSRNHPKVDLITADIKALDPAECLRRVALRAGELRVLIGGPPCQGFSESNRRTRGLDNPKNMLYSEFFRFLRVMQPEWFVLENVAGLRSLAGGIVLKAIIDSARALGYNAEYKELMSADFGVPQHRRRIFIIGNRIGWPICFPDPTHGTNGTTYVTVREAISDLPLLDNGASIDILPYVTSDSQLTGYVRLMNARGKMLPQIQGNLVTRNSEKILSRYKYILPGQNWEAIPPTLMDNYSDFSRCHTGIYHRLEWDKPAKVIGNFRKNMLIHPNQHRGLSVREAARIQSFPDDYVFLGSIGFQQQQVADAVPPLLAEAVARSISRHGINKRCRRRV